MRQFISDLFGIDPATIANVKERGKDIRLACIIGLLVSTSFAVFNLTVGFVALGLIEGAAALLLLPAAYFLSHSERMLSAETLVMLSAIIINAALFHFGGVDSTGIYWILSLPFITFFVTGQRRGWLWAFGFLVLLLFIPSAAGISQTQEVHFFFGMLFYMVLAASFNMLRVRFEEKLARQVKEKTAVATAYLEQLQFLAKHDELTGLPNREGILDLLDDEIKRQAEDSEALVVIYIKLIRIIELINIVGTEQGAVLFAQIVANLKNAVQRSGKAGRLGRDEFVFFFSCKDLDLEASGWLASTLGAGFECLLGNQTVNIEYVAGACIHGDEAEAEVLLRKAEQAMLTAKEAHYDFFIYNADNDREFISHHLLFSKLRKALQQNQLEMYYQPQVDLHTGRLTGAEALARWTDPTEGPIPPLFFIPVAEQSGLIFPLTRWVIATAIAQCAQWRNAGLDLGIAINLSARNLADADLLAYLENMATDFCVPPEKITMELTEGVFLDISQKSANVIRHMHEKGFRISIDDYGTGYSSLSYIKGLPVTELKIDQCFIKGIMESHSDALIVQSTIDMALQLDLEVVAEGVEEASIVSQLRDFGCRVGQGYYFGRPMSAVAFDLWAQQDACAAKAQA
ncbi:MAG: hypothetical protein A2505_04560 [Deltaproteobacteria bacterium RIFOXYD12_FULL_55_16]|nr:MAG: hypothetical protein A2505_04560 [Deltaproteobacteria bacterium RIFOXYD12_FULL_55_16]